MGQKREKTEPAPMVMLAAHPPTRPVERKRSGINLESTEAEQLGVLPHQCTRVKESMNRSVPVVTPLTEIREAVRLLKLFDVESLLICNNNTLVGTLSDRDIALANAPPSEPVHRVMTLDPSFCFEDDLLIDAQEVMRVRRLNALPVKEASGRLSGIVRRRLGGKHTGRTAMLFLLPLITALWLATAWCADITPPLDSRADTPQAPNAPPPSRIDPGIERRPQTIPDPRSAVTPPIVDPKIAIDPETSPPITEKQKPLTPVFPPGTPPTH